MFSMSHSQRSNSLKCPIAAHWGCLAKTQRDEILRAAHERDKAEWRLANSGGPEPSKRNELGPYQTTEFICGSCMKGGICMGCKQVALKPDQFTERSHSTSPPDDPNQGASTPANDTRAGSSTLAPEKEESPARELLFRCFTCKRLAHYAHLPTPDGYEEDTSATDRASYYQYDTGWKCADCFSYVYHVEHILAWRPYPEDAVEPPRAADEYPNYKAMLPREYLIKWVDRSYRRVQWVPHGWLLAVAPNKLRNFLMGGSKVTLLPEPVSEEQRAAGTNDTTAFDIGRDEADDAQGNKEDEGTTQLTASPDAEKRIPPAWQTVDRVLDIRLWRPNKAVRGKGKKARVDDSGDEASSNPEIAQARDKTYDLGEEPPTDMMVTIEEYESLVGRKLGDGDADQVAWAFFKWDDLGYDDGECAHT